MFVQIPASGLLLRYMYFSREMFRDEEEEEEREKDNHVQLHSHRRSVYR